MKIQVLGSGCSRCETTERLVRETARRLGVAVDVEAVHDVQRIAALGVMSTPAVVIDGKVMLSGRVPLAGQIEGWLTNAG